MKNKGKLWQNHIASIGAAAVGTSRDKVMLNSEGIKPIVLVVIELRLCEGISQIVSQSECNLTCYLPKFYIFNLFLLVHNSDLLQSITLLYFSNSMVLFQLQVGTLDSLVGLSDQLAKLDPFVEGLVRHISQYIADILGPEDLPKLHENLLVGSGNNKGVLCVLHACLQVSSVHDLHLFIIFASK